MLKLNLSKLSTYSSYENYTVCCNTNKGDIFECNFPSDISDKLIRITAKVTERYASDLLISIDSIKSKLSEKLKNKQPINETFYFGFRDSGVDHTEWVELTSCNEFNSRYIQLWKLEINDNLPTTYYNTIDWKLTRMSNYVSRDMYVEIED